MVSLAIQFRNNGESHVDAAAQKIHPQGYNPALDSLRGIAVLCVILMHAEHYFFDLGVSWFPGGFLGVDLFFVLSGFLITRILLNSFNQHGRLNYRSFYFNRVLRLFPALALLLVVYYAYTRISNQPQLLELDAIFAIVFYYFNWFLIGTLKVPEGLGHMWSLAIEEQFYLFWPFLLVLLLRNMTQTRLVVASFLVMVAAVIIWRAYLWYTDTSWLFIYVRTDTRIDSILMGAFLAYLLSKNMVKIPHIQILSPIAAATLFLSVLSFDNESPFLYVGGFTLIAILASVLIFHAANEHKDGTIVFDCVFFRWLGKISYGLYLWHIPIFVFVSAQTEMISGSWQTTIALTCLITVTLSSWYLVERPFLNLKARL